MFQFLYSLVLFIFISSFYFLFFQMTRNRTKVENPESGKNLPSKFLLFKMLKFFWHISNTIFNSFNAQKPTTTFCLLTLGHNLLPNNFGPPPLDNYLFTYYLFSYCLFSYSLQPITCHLLPTTFFLRPLDYTLQSITLILPFANHLLPTTFCLLPSAYYHLHPYSKAD